LIELQENNETAINNEYRGNDFIPDKRIF